VTGLVGTWWLRLAVTVAVLGYLASRIDGPATWQAVLGLSGATLALIALIAAVDRALMAWRWILLVRATGVELTTKSGLWIFLVSSFLGSFAPAGIGGDVARAWELDQRTSRGSDAVASVAVDRWLGLASVAVLGAFGLANWTRGFDADISLAMHILLVLVVVGSIAGVWADRIVAAVLPAAWTRRTPWSQLTRLADSMAHFRREWPTLLWVAMLSLAVQVIRVVLAWVLGTGLGIDVGLDYYLVVMPVGIVLILLPISIGGFGPAQGAIVWMMRPLGVDEGLAFAMSTLFVLVGVVANLPGALLYLGRRH